MRASNATSSGSRSGKSRTIGSCISAKRLHHHQQDVSERAVVLHPVFEQRAQKIGVIGRERQ